MTQYTNYYRPAEVCLGDTVKFEYKGKYYTYKVQPDHLSQYGDCKCFDNAEIFRAIEHSRLDICQFATIAYGYRPLNEEIILDPGNMSANKTFPQYKFNDFPAVTRLINNIFVLIDTYTKGSKTYTINYRPNLLKKGDRIVFIVGDKRLEYDVPSGGTYLHYASDNARIFTLLNIGDRGSFASKAYGYEARNVEENKKYFPECHKDDMVALTKIANALFDMIIKREEKIGIYSNHPEPEATFLRNLSECEVTINNNLNHGKVIKAERPTPTVERGEEIIGCRIQGKKCPATVGIGHLSYSKIVGRGY